MRNHVMSLIVAVIAVLVFSSVAETAQQSAVASEPRDLSGIWEESGGYRSMSQETPPMTREGQRRFDANKTGRNSRERQGIPPAFGNDPIMECNPYGIPRLLFFTRPVEFIQIPGRLLQFFEWTRATREIWMDGRELPKDPDPRWMGYSVGRWEGDTLVVDTIGFDDRAWLDQYGHIYSTEMRFQERWRRVDRDTLEATYRLEDPKTYTKPWVSEKKTFKLQPKSELTFDGWYGLREEFCAPMDEGSFNQRIRNPAGGVTKK